jgi:hypothetical protein
MHWKSTEVDGADRADRAGSEYKVSEAVKTVRTFQNSLGRNGTRLGLLLLLVGPNGDGFGGQAFMEHYNTFFWAEWITTHKALGHSTYYIVHGVEPLLLFDLTEATYMVPLQSTMTTTELVALQAR